MAEEWMGHLRVKLLSVNIKKKTEGKRTFH